MSQYSHLFDYCMCVKSDRTRNKHTDSWSQWCPTNHSVRRPTTNIWDSPKLSKTSLVCWAGGERRGETQPDRAGASWRRGQKVPACPGPGCSRLVFAARQSVSFHLEPLRADLGSFSALPSAAPGISSRLALIVNSHMINLSAWRVGRIEAPELFPLG